MAENPLHGPPLEGRGDALITIRSCSRLGRRANPPRASLGNLLRRR